MLWVVGEQKGENYTLFFEKKYFAYIRPHLTNFYLTSNTQEGKVFPQVKIVLFHCCPLIHTPYYYYYLN